MTALPPIEIDEKKFLYDHCSLPPLPDIVIRLKEIIRSDTVNVSDVSRLIGKDPALVAQILKIVNSAYYGLPREISEINFAVGYLGIHEIYRTVLSLSVINTLNMDQAPNFKEFWYHSNYTALCAKFLAKRFCPLLPQEKLWPAALLHDIGKLVYIKFFPDHFKAITSFCKKNEVLFSQAEIHYKLPSSAYFGALLCKRWRLPKAIKDACESHRFNNLKSIEGGKMADDLINMITLGNYLAIISNDPVKTEIKEKIALKIREKIKYSEKQFLSMMGEIYDLKNEVDRLL